MLTALAAAFCHGGVTVPYLGSSSSGSPSAPCSGHIQQGRAHPAAGRPAGTQPISEWGGEGFWGKKTPSQDRRPQHCSAVPAAQGELSVPIWEISPRFRLCEGVWAGYIRTFAPTPHWWLSKQSWARGSKPLGMNSYLLRGAVQPAAEDVPLAARQQASAQHQPLQPGWIQDSGVLYHQLSKLQLPYTWLKTAVLTGRKTQTQLFIHDQTARAGLPCPTVTVAHRAPAPQEGDTAAVWL